MVASISLCSCSNNSPGDGYYYPLQYSSEGEYAIMEYDFNDKTPIEYSKGYNMMHTVLGFSLKKNSLTTFIVSPVVDEEIKGTAGITYKFTEDQKYELEYFEGTISIKSRGDSSYNDIFKNASSISYKKGCISINRDGDSGFWVTKSYAKNNKYVVIKG